MMAYTYPYYAFTTDDGPVYLMRFEMILVPPEEAFSRLRKLSETANHANDERSTDASVEFVRVMIHLNSQLFGAAPIVRLRLFEDLLTYVQSQASMHGLHGLFCSGLITAASCAEGSLLKRGLACWQKFSDATNHDGALRESSVIDAEYRETYFLSKALQQDLVMTLPSFYAINSAIRNASFDAAREAAAKNRQIGDWLGATDVNPNEGSNFNGGAEGDAGGYGNAPTAPGDAGPMQGNGPFGAAWAPQSGAALSSYLDSLNDGGGLNAALGGSEAIRDIAGSLPTVLGDGSAGPIHHEGGAHIGSFGTKMTDMTNELIGNDVDTSNAPTMGGHAQTDDASTTNSGKTAATATAGPVASGQTQTDEQKKQQCVATFGLVVGGLAAWATGLLGFGATLSVGIVSGVGTGATGGLAAPAGYVATVGTAMTAFGLTMGAFATGNEVGKGLGGHVCPIGGKRMDSPDGTSGGHGSGIEGLYTWRIVGTVLKGKIARRGGCYTGSGLTVGRTSRLGLNTFQQKALLDSLRPGIVNPAPDDISGGLHRHISVTKADLLKHLLAPVI
jgi:hypothetical protein